MCPKLVNKLLALLLLTAVSVSLYAQAGKDTYQFLNIPSTARTAAFGGYNVSSCDGDLNMSLCNPAVLSYKTHNMLTMSYSNYFKDVNLGSVAYGRTLFGDKNHFAFGVHYIDFGRFKGTTAEDEYTGDFFAKDIAFNVLYTRELPKGFSVGVNMKPIFSMYERYRSYGMAFDFGAIYNNDSALVSVGLVLRNVGWQFRGYSSIDGVTQREPLPFDIQLGISKRLKHAPLRFSLTMHNLQRWNLGYERSSSVLEQYNKGDVKWVDMLFRHTIWSLEILPTENVYLMVSYNHRRRAEMNIPDFKTIAGFSFGGGVKIYKFNLHVSVSSYQVGALSYQVSFGTCLSEFGVN